MKIRNKLAITIVSAFLLNNLLLLAYYEMFLSQGVSAELVSLQGDLDYTLESICNEIKKDNNYDISYIKEVINKNEKFKDQEEYFIEVKDTKENILAQKGINVKGAVKVTSSDIIEIDNKALQITMIQSLPIDTVKNIPIFKEIARAQMLIITFILILLMAIIYIKTIKPIIELQKDMENYKYGIKPVKVKRQDEIGWLKNEFVELAEQLEEEKESQNRIIASISHDIKTPLTSIMGYAERLNNKNISQERQKKYLDIMHTKSQDIKILIEEFDDYLSYNLENTMKMKKINAKDLANLINEEYEDELNQLNINFLIEYNCDDSYIEVDLSKIRRVFGNIIGNSIKNMKYLNKKITVTFENIKDDILIDISDNGTGVEEEDLEKIFEALYTSDKSRKVAGLGLSICKSAILGHKGQIWAQNNEQGGLSIKFTIPRVKV